MTDPISIEDFLATAAPRTDKVRVCARGDLVERHAELVDQINQALREATKGDALATDADVDDTEVERIAEEIVAVEAEMEASTMEVHMRSIGAQAWADLLREYPPEKHHRGYAHNPDTFPPAAVAACAVTPKITVDQANAMFKQLHSGEWTKLWISAINLNETATPRPKLAAATDLLRANRPSAGSSVNGGSLAESSSAGSGAQ